MASRLLRGAINRSHKLHALMELRLPLPDRIVRETSDTNDPRIIVSLTTFPDRYDSLWKTLHSLACQTVQPDSILVVVAECDYVSAKAHPGLQSYLDRGAELVVDEGDRRSYKKLLPAIKRFPKAVVVTADDDVLYPRKWLERLLAIHREDPDCIVGHRGTEIVLRQDAVGEYRDWPKATSKSDPVLTFLTGMGGILYPPNSLHDDVHDYELAFSLCPTADDIWFKIMALRRGIGAVVTGYGDGDFPVSAASKIGDLTSINVTLGQNDSQLDACLKHFGRSTIFGDL